MRYNPTSIFAAVADVPSLARWVQDELQAIARVVNHTADMILDTANAVPAKPREGMIRFADGTNWNPGSGKGFYGYYSGSWHFLG